MSNRNSKDRNRLMFALLILSMMFVLASCGSGGGSYTGATIPQVTAKVESVSSAALGRSFRSRTLDSPTISYGYINSGAPDYLVVTLKQIDVVTDQGTAVVWSGSQQLTLNGSGSLSVSDLTLTNVPTETITQINLRFDNQATIKGTLIGGFGTPGGDQSNPGQITLYTRSAYPYDAVAHSGGSNAYTDFQAGPAQDMTVSLSGNSGEAIVSTPANFTPDPNNPPTLTILFDLSRMLRFYDGLKPGSGGGVNPPDPNDKAYFFCHSVFTFSSVAAFFGPVGKIQGYQTLFESGSEYVPGWMTLIFDADNNLISGLLIGDDDNALTIGKGIITSSSQVGNVYGFHYNISQVDISGFQIPSSVGNYADVSWSQPGNSRSGSARFTLQFETAQ